MNFYNQCLDNIYKQLDSNKSGLNNTQVENNQKVYGKNVIDKQKTNSFFKKFLLQFKNIMIIILLIAAIISCVFALINNDAENLFEAILIFSIVIINAFVGVIQEHKAEKALNSLTKITEPYTTVIRNGSTNKIKSADVVVGDILLLKAGDYLPADVRIIESKDLKCDESSLTGESNYIAKNNEVLNKQNLQINEQTNMCFCGTSIRSGHAKAIVTAVGKHTEIGKIAKILNTSLKEKTPLEKEIDKIGKVLTFGILSIVFLVFMIQILLNNNVLIIDAILTSVALAVAAIPESLPAVITIIMAIGVERLARKNAIIKKLSAVETLGCCNVICSDKTGTLTKNEMQVNHIFYNLKIENPIIDIKNMQQFCNICAVCNNITTTKNSYVGDATEIAIANLLKSNNIDIQPLKTKYVKIDESEFNSTKKQMRVLCKNNNSQILFAKGAIDYLILNCTKILINNKEEKLTEYYKQLLLQQNEKICKLGERVIAFAYKENAVSMECDDLTFVGFCGIIDPPKKETFDAIKKCKRAGLKTIMITGDHPETAFAIAKKLHIAKVKTEVLTGKDLDNLSDKELNKIISKYSVFARVTPEHKYKIVKALKSQSNVVAMTGDGINDAPSIKHANIGVCMGKTGTDVTKEVSDIIISDDNFSTIVLAIEEGRTIYQNISKTIVFLLSTNIVEVLGIFITSLIMPNAIFLTPVQILFINLITDSLPAFALGIEPPEKNIMDIPPRNPHKSILSGKTGSLILYEGFIQTFAVLIMFVFAHNIYGAEIASTMSFLTICLMQIIHAINCKTEKSIFKTNFLNNHFFNLSFIFLLSLILGVYFIPIFANIFNLYTLTINQWIYVLLTSISIIPLVEFCKIIVK